MKTRELEPDAMEREMLAVAEGLADQIESLKASVAAEGHTAKLKSGRIVIHPAVAEIRQTSAALARVLDTIEMYAEATKDPKKVAAAQARWRAHNQRKAAFQAAGE
ncbi:hypothetical protein GBP75_23775 [Mycobacterium avium subsp. hominissuis]|nr:hypothetical protein [Mycobacterium avium subsp. hominissuis]MBZ4609027.1 hypothetical protein [Mycobacterium avium subsp. hominissuis]